MSQGRKIHPETTTLDGMSCLTLRYCLYVKLWPNRWTERTVLFAPNAFSRLKMNKCVCGWGSAPDPAGGAYSAPPDLLAGLRGPTSEERGGEGGRNAAPLQGGIKGPVAQPIWPGNGISLRTTTQRRHSLAATVSTCRHANVRHPQNRKYTTYRNDARGRP